MAAVLMEGGHGRVLEAMLSWFGGRTAGEVVDHQRLFHSFGDVERGTIWYGSMRSLQFRRLRLPKPLVKRGDYPA